MNHWIWQPHPGHFICSQWCQFRLNTVVGTNVKWIVSTVGEYLPAPASQQICADIAGVILVGKGDAREADFMKKLGFQDIGYKRKYETMVFLAKPITPASCCAYEMVSGRDVDSQSYNEPLPAYHGHIELCTKWDNIIEMPHEDDGQ